MKTKISDAYFKEIIGKVPNIDFCDIKKDVATISFKDGSSTRINIVLSDSGYPKQIKDIINDYVSKEYTVIIAPYISDQTAKICKDANFGYLDMSGNCYISFGSIYMEIKGNKNNNIPKRALKSIYEKSATVSSSVLRVMLMNYKKSWKLNELAKSVGCSIGQVSKVKDFLSNQSLLEQDKDGVRITDPETLMKDWSNVYSKNDEERIYCYSLDSIPVIENKISKMENELGICCFLTGISGASRYQPSVRYNKVYALIDEKNVKRAIDYLGLKQVDTGANVVFIIKYDFCVDIDCRKIKNSTVASPVQVYLDCMNIKGRGEEQAEMILKREICE